MNKEKILGIVRHILTFGGGYAVAKGYLDDAAMLEMVGATVTVIGGIWSILSPEKKAA